MLYDHAHAMQVKLCKANTRGVTSSIPSNPGQSSGDASSNHEVPSNPGQSSGDASSDHEEYFKLKEAYLKVTDLCSGASLNINKLHDELKATHATLGIAQQEAT